MIQAVIFDLDGVLIDSKKLHYLAWKKFWAKRGITHTWKDFMKFFGMDNKNIFPLIYKNLSARKIDALGEEKERYYRQIAKGVLHPTNGTVALLESLKKSRYGIAIATSTPKSNISFVLKQTGLKKYFSAVICASDVKRGKPHPEIFLKAAKALGAKPQDCIVIEDSVHGIEAAKAAGMKCIALTTTHKPSELTKADMVVKDLSRLSVRNMLELEK